MANFSKPFAKIPWKPWKSWKNQLPFPVFLKNWPKKVKFSKLFATITPKTLKNLKKNQLPFPVFGKIKVFKANFSNFLLKYLENLKNQLTSGEFLSHPVEKINFRFRLKHFFHFQTPFSPTFCHYNAQNMRNLEKKSLLPVKNQLPFPVFQALRQKRWNSTNFLPKY